MVRPILHADVRDTKGSPDLVRSEGLVPAIIYGGGRLESTAISLNHSELLKVVRTTSESTMIDVVIGDQTVQALLGEVQRDPLTEHMTHVDLRQLDLTKPVTASISLTFVGEAPAVRALGGNLVISKDYIDVRALPTALVDHIEIDLSRLTALDSSIHVSDVPLPEGVTLDDDAQSAVVVIRQQKEDAFDAPAAAAPDAAAIPTVAEQAKKEKEQKAAEEAKV